MCGIEGIVGLPKGIVFSVNMAKMTKALSHREPDDLGCVLIDEKNAPIEFLNVSDLDLPEHNLSNYGIGFGHTRLVVIAYGKIAQIKNITYRLGQ